ncbi:la-related protein 7 [Pectinophora gossypiella]|uniref:la-related protein 7 n=1 Tax=Pectinophora gossypiella TaxID=13191 RepID=UPI00214F5BBB|nr:la-related protein 7 [Pectinophora gossypiella]
MSESETTEVSGQETKLGHSPRKRIRHRKKQLYENIMKQMEFYFSDANLTKDRFLGDLVKSDPYVPLDVFLKFNKIRSMTQDVNDIAKAMKHSTILELSEDKSKVRRKTPVQAYDADLRTVYVESIPVTATREWLQRVFSVYGDVAYISLPKFKNSQKIKGYGFIEFKKPEDAQKCLNMFIKMGCKLPTCMPPEELSSIKMFSIEEAPEDADNSHKEEKHEECEPPKKKKKNKEKKSKNLELKLEQESDGEKRDTPTRSSEENKSITTPNEEIKTSEVESSKDEMTSQDEGADEATRKKKTRKRTAKERSKAKKSLGPNEASKGALWGLQVLSKSEWKSLRNKYLNLQRKYMKEVKKTLQNKRHALSGIPAPAASVEAEQAIINPQASEASKSVAPLERIPGVFVKEVLPEPCLDVRLTKRTVRSNVHVLHVEAKEGQSEIVMRFDSAKAADEYCAQSSNRARVLSGGEEEEQWTRAEAARNSKRVRGRARLLERHDALGARAALAPASPQPTHTHIRFDE